MINKKYQHSFASIALSLAMQERAKKRIPGMTQLLSKRPDRFSSGVWPGYFSKTKGSRVWDLDGNEYVDMSISGVGACILGYADPDVDSKVKKAIDNGVASTLNCAEEVELAEYLCELHPWADMVRFTRSGGEAMAVAVRIARAHTGRDKVAFCGYHGWHDWYLCANIKDENALGDHLMSGLSPIGVPKCLAGTAIPFHYNRLDELEAIVDSNRLELAAIIMEPIRSLDPEPGFIEGVRSVANDAGAVFIMDEISAGFRLTTGGAHMVLHSVTPDLAVFSKALGNGYAISAIIGTEQVMESAQKSFISSTNWTERIGAVAALETLKKHQRTKCAEHLNSIGLAVHKGWRNLATKHGLPIDVSGINPMGHFNFGCEAPSAAKAYFIQLMLEKGFLANTSFYAMNTHTKTDVRNYLKCVDEAFAKIKTGFETGDLLKRLKGEPSAMGFKRLN